jgi:hypothetical protein
MPPTRALHSTFSAFSSLALTVPLLAGLALGGCNPFRLCAFSDSVASSMQAAMSPYDALRTSADAHLAPAGQGDAIAKVALCLAADFDAANGSALGTDAQGLARVALAYHGSVAALRDHGTAKLALPFLLAVPEGPLHFDRTLTPAEVTAMFQRPAAAPKKRGWWPFG